MQLFGRDISIPAPVRNAFSGLSARAVSLFSFPLRSPAFSAASLTVLSLGIVAAFFFVSPSTSEGFEDFDPEFAPPLRAYALIYSDQELSVQEFNEILEPLVSAASEHDVLAPDLFQNPFTPFSATPDIASGLFEPAYHFASNLTTSSDQGFVAASRFLLKDTPSLASFFQDIEHLHHGVAQLSFVLQDDPAFLDTVSESFSPASLLQPASFVDDLVSSVPFGSVLLYVLLGLFLLLILAAFFSPLTHHSRSSRFISGLIASFLSMLSALAVTLGSFLLLWFVEFPAPLAVSLLLGFLGLFLSLFVLVSLREERLAREPDPLASAFARFVPALVLPLLAVVLPILGLTFYMLGVLPALGLFASFLLLLLLSPLASFVFAFLSEGDSSDPDPHGFARPIASPALFVGELLSRASVLRHTLLSVVLPLLLIVSSFLFLFAGPGLQRLSGMNTYEPSSFLSSAPATQTVVNTSFSEVSSLFPALNVQQVHVSLNSDRVFTFDAFQQVVFAHRRALDADLVYSGSLVLPSVSIVDYAQAHGVLPYEMSSSLLASEFPFWVHHVPQENSTTLLLSYQADPFFRDSAKDTFEALFESLPRYNVDVSISSTLFAPQELPFSFFREQFEFSSLTDILIVLAASVLLLAFAAHRRFALLRLGFISWSLTLLFLLFLFTLYWALPQLLSPGALSFALFEPGFVLLLSGLLLAVLSFQLVIDRFREFRDAGLNLFTTPTVTGEFSLAALTAFLLTVFSSSVLLGLVFPALIPFLFVLNLILFSILLISAFLLLSLLVVSDDTMDDI